ncbi:MAG: hypothetical protein Q7S21_06785 [archaeon]|nr:hypothetical protein [archaeon]
MALIFKYKKELIDGEKFYFPKLPITLHNNQNKTEQPALLDSGATAIFIPKHIADFLELELGNSSTAESWTGKFKIFESKIWITLGKGSQTFRKQLSCNIPDIEGENEEVILGRTFFQFFEICFNEKNKTTKLKQI